MNGSLNNNALNMLNAQCAWTITKGNSNIIVGVVDTEFQTTHEDLVNTFAGIVGTRTHPQDHGTPVTSCVATGTNNHLGIAGIGYNTKVRGYHVNGSTLWNGIWNAYLDGVKIINVSWTGIGSYPNVLAVQELVNNGVVLVLAAGNEDQYIYHSAYANIPGVINVSGVAANNHHASTLGANFPGQMHAHNQYVDVCALSVNVTVCTPNNGYSSTWRGTSFAAPQVAGVVALMRSVNPNLTPTQIENIIKATTDPVADAHLFPGLLGTGRVNAYSALKQTLCTLPNVTFSRTVNSEVIVNGNTVNVQNTTVTSTGKLYLNACNQVNIGNGFTVQPGGSLIIKQGQ